MAQAKAEEHVGETGTSSEEKEEEHRDIVSRLESEEKEEKPIGPGKDERQEVGGKPIKQEDAAHLMAEAMKAGKTVTPESLPARAESAVSVNIQKGVVPPGPGLGDVKPFDEEPAQSDLKEHWQEIGGKPGEKRDVAGKLLTPDDASRIQKMEARLGHGRGKGSLTARAASASAANVREGLVSLTSGAGTFPLDKRGELEKLPPEEREKFRREVHLDLQRQQQSQ